MIGRESGVTDRSPGYKQDDTLVQQPQTDACEACGGPEGAELQGESRNEVCLEVSKEPTATNTITAGLEAV